MRDYVRRVLARDTLKVAVVGDIDAATLGRVLDRMFGALPAKSELMRRFRQCRCRRPAAASWSTSTCRRR